MIILFYLKNSLNLNRGINNYKSCDKMEKDS